MKESSATAVRDLLEKASIKSIVDAAEDGFGFWEHHMRQPGAPCTWVVVTAPAASGFGADGQFFHHDRFERISELFPVVLHFFQEEDGRRWHLKLKTPQMLVERSLYESPGEFSATERAVLEQVFERDFTTMAPLLQPGKGAEFLNSVGIAYFEMLDQDRSVWGDLPGGRSSVLRAELED